MGTEPTVAAIGTGATGAISATGAMTVQPRGWVLLWLTLSLSLHALLLLWVNAPGRPLAKPVLPISLNLRLIVPAVVPDATPARAPVAAPVIQPVRAADRVVEARVPKRADVVPKPQPPVKAANAKPLLAIAAAPENSALAASAVVPAIAPTVAESVTTAALEQGAEKRAEASTEAITRASADTSAEALKAQTRDSAAHQAPATALTEQQQLLGRYAQQLSRLLASQQEYPRLAALRGWQGEVRLRLKLARKGNLLALQVDRSSGHEILDQHALQLVDLVRMPPFPEALEGSEIQITVPVNYTLKEAV